LPNGVRRLGAVDRRREFVESLGQFFDAAPGYGGRPEIGKLGYFSHEHVCDEIEDIQMEID